MSGGVAARLVPSIVAAFAWLLWPTAAMASGDVGCTASWKLRHRDLTGCDSMAMLSPGNDTRVNLVLLLTRAGGNRRAAAPATAAEPRPEPLFDWASFERWTFPKPAGSTDDDHAVGEGSRCLSDASGTADFAAAIGAAPQMTAGEKASLIAARRALHPTCTDAGKGSGQVASSVASASSRLAKEFGAYLQGATAFYAGDFATAAARFASLDAAGVPWLRETARYMTARVEVNRAQVGAFDEYGVRDDKRPINARVVAAAERQLREYLRAYPAGLYASSARGLLRRVYWLGGDEAKLAAEYVALFDRSSADRGLDDAALAEEIDTKLLPRLTAADTTDTTLLAVLDLEAMRGDDTGAASPAAISQAALESQRPLFAHDPALFEHLLATYAFYVARHPADVLRLVPDAARQPAFDSLQFSGQMLRGMALDAVGDRNARGFWLELIAGTTPPFQRVTAELALALHDERTGGLERVFEPGSPVHDPSIRDLLLTNVAGAPLLRRQAHDAAAGEHERAVALFTLLYKEVTRGAYRDFLADVAAVPPGALAKGDNFDFVGAADPSVGLFTKGVMAEDFACPTLRDTVNWLAADSHKASAQLCLAEFVRLNDLDGFLLDTQPPADELGGTRSSFAGPPFSRLEVYKSVIAGVKTTAADRAYALYRAVNCYAPSQINRFGGTEVPPAQRKAWFQRLHTDFPASHWAEALEYYW